MKKKPTYETLERRVKELESKLHEHKLLELELQNIFDLSLDMIGSGNLEGYFTKINSSFQNIIGYTPEEFLDKQFLFFVHEDDVEKTSNALEAAITGIQQIYIENRYKCKNGGYKWIEWNVSAIAKENKFIAVGRDITDRKKAEETLIANELKYRTLFESNAFISYITDIKGKILLANKNGARFMNETEQSIIGKSFFDLRPDRKEMYQKVIDTILSTGKTFQFETMYPDRSQEKWLFVTVSPLKVNNKLKLQIITQDITERKKAAAELLKSQEKIMRLKKMESLGLLAGGVAHDLNNILSGIVSYPELILMNLPENSKLRKPIEIIQEAGHNAAAVVQDLLTVARGVATSKTTLNFNNIIDDYLNSPEFKNLKQRHTLVTVKTNLDKKLLNIVGSYIHIKKVLMNLVSNAAEAIEDSGTVTISTMNTYVEKPIRGYEEINIGEYAVLAVSDDGTGISSIDLERVFEPFYTKKEMGKSGTGLGLTVVWNAVKDHNGFIDVKREEKRITFQLYFPITRDEIAISDIPLPFQALKGNGEKILVVDDIKSQCEISCKMLDILGYEAISASSGEKACEYLKNHSADLLLLDMIMEPGINGRETYERIIEINPQQKAIIVSGFSETEEVKQIQKLGAGQYLKKPITLEMIGIAVKEELQKKT